MNILRNLYYTSMCSRLTYAVTSWGSALNSTSLRIESLIPCVIYLIIDQSNSSQFEMNPKFIQTKRMHDCFVLKKIR